MYHQCVKWRLSGRPIRILANPNPFRQGEVNFVETMFYDEFGPDDESPTPRTPTLVLEEEEEEEEEGRGTYDLRNFLDRKRQKKEISSSES